MLTITFISLQSAIIPSLFAKKKKNDPSVRADLGSWSWVFAQISGPGSEVILVAKNSFVLSDFPPPLSAQGNKHSTSRSAFLCEDLQLSALVFWSQEANPSLLNVGPGKRILLIWSSAYRLIQQQFPSIVPVHLEHFILHRQRWKPAIIMFILDMSNKREAE